MACEIKAPSFETISIIIYFYQGLIHPPGLERQNKKHASSSGPWEFIFTQEIWDFKQKPCLLNYGDMGTHRPRLVMEDRVPLLIVFRTWLQMVRTADSSFVSPHICQPGASFSFQGDSALIGVTEIPLEGSLGPFRVMATFSGTSAAWLLRTVFVLE